MATIKHIASKSSDYSAAESYLIFQHDEYRNIPILDDQGQRILREAYLTDTVECGDEDYAMACIHANKKFVVNDKTGDIKSHHYIISFDPRDSTDNGLTMEKAQALGLEFCKKHFPGHPAIVATHPDGHNHSGNIHVHIVINSLRVRDVERLPFMEKPCDWQAGKKHCCTASMLRYLRSEVMEMCTEAGLYQIDLLNGSREKITEREYWAQKRGQRQLDWEIAQGKLPKDSKYQTDKAILRKQIRAVLYKAKSFEEFSNLLQQNYGVSVKESRGRLSYLTTNRTKPITSRKLGEDFGKKAVLAALKENTERQHDIRFRIQQDDRIGRLVDIEKKVAEGKGAGYQRWAKVFNVKQMAKTMLALRQMGITSEDQLKEKVDSVSAAFDEVNDALREIEAKLTANRELKKFSEDYRKYAPIARQERNAKNPAAFREEHHMELTLYHAAARYLKAHNVTKLPAPKDLQAEREALISQKGELYQAYRESKEQLSELRKLQMNINDFYSKEAEKEREAVR